MTLQLQPRQWTHRGPVCLVWEIQTYASLNAYTVTRGMPDVSNTKNDSVTRQMDCNKLLVMGTMHGQHQGIWLLLQPACK